VSASCGTDAGYGRHRRAGELPCPPCRAAHSAARRDRKYGLEPGEYDRTYAEQQGRCFICGGEHPPGKLVVDHDHATGDVRKLLCNYCNTTLGMALENVLILRRCVLYVEGNLRSAPDEFLGDLSKKRVDTSQLRGRVAA
jgi:hypothetical protein